MEFSVVNNILKPYRKSVISYNRLSEQLEINKRILKRKQEVGTYCGYTLKQIQSLEDSLMRIDLKGEKVFKALSYLDGVEYEIIYGYFVLARPLEIVFRSMFYSNRKLYYVKKQALIKLENLYTGGFI